MKNANFLLGIIRNDTENKTGNNWDIARSQAAYKFNKNSNIIFYNYSCYV